jgi:acyl-CoA dehydrogenase
LDRSIFSEEHELFRQSFVKFVQREVVPNQPRWHQQGRVDRDAWRKAGAAGFRCPWLEPEHGGPGGDFLHSLIVNEELSRAYESGFSMSLHSDIIVPYIHQFGSAEQKQRWLPGCASGEIVTALAMTEPGTGSDLAAIATSAVRDGDHYLINGAKTFISNGLSCDLCIVAAKTDRDPNVAHRGISLIVVEAGTPGFVRGKQLEKMGMFSQDTSELSFEDCRVPIANRLGEEGAGFMMLMQNLQQERLVVACGAQASAEQVLADTLVYVKQRKAFGKPIGSFQNTKFKLAECATKIEVGRAFIDKLVSEHMQKKHLVKECSMAKMWQTEMLGEVVDTCLQFFGGYGYMLEYPIARAYMDARVQRIFAGTNEIMRVIVAKQLGL